MSHSDLASQATRLDRLIEPPVSRAAALLPRLSRRTSSGRFIPEVDGLRFLAIALVLFFHTKVLTAVLSGSATVVQPFGNGTVERQLHQSLLGAAVLQGQLGVHIFFVISGFILALPFAAHRLRGDPAVSLKRYYARRLTRLEPPYLLALLFSFLAASLVSDASLHSLVPRFLSGLVYQHNAFYGEPNWLNGAFWSLEIEVQFYLLAPVLGTVFLIRNALPRRLILLLGFVATITLQAMFVVQSPRLSFSLANFLQLFLVGFLLADVYVTEWDSHPSRHWIWDVLGLVGLALLLSGHTPIQIGLPLVAALIFCGAMRGPVMREVLTNRWIVTVGGMCYSIYLLHYPLILLIGRWSRSLLMGSPDVSFLLQLLATIPLAVSAGLVLFVLVERPCMDPRWPTRARASLDQIWYGVVAKERSRGRLRRVKV